MITLHQENLLSPLRIDNLRKKIDNKDYLYEGIQRIAQILSDELVDDPKGGVWYERKRGK
jgi:hypothetical protein